MSLREYAQKKFGDQYMQEYISRLESLNDSCTFRQIYEEVHGADFALTFGFNLAEVISLDVPLMLCVPVV